MTLIFALLAIYQLKHFIADYPLQNKYMLGKFKSGRGWVLPLLSHVAVHGLFTALIALLFKPGLAVKLALFDMAIHFIIDRIKASPAMLGRFKPLTKNEMTKAMTVVGVYVNNIPLCNGKKSPFEIGSKSDIKWQNAYNEIKSNTYFWWALGFDQMVHHLTHYAIIYWLVT